MATPESVHAVRSLVPARMDRLPWARFHWSVVVGLGISWILDGLEIQLVAANGYARSLGMGAAEIGLAGTVYLLGQVIGAITFGRLTDRWGRKPLFIITLAIYLIASGSVSLCTSMWLLLVLRFIAGLGIGGEYTAINSAINELIPARYRGRVDLAVNGTYWMGALLGATANVWLLDPEVIDQNWGWRISFLIGPVLGLVIIYLRRYIPESPRWLLTHGHATQAEATVAVIEDRVRADGGWLDEVPESRAILLRPRESVPLSQLARVFLRDYPRRTVLGLVMMITQSFLYNAIFFTYALVLEHYYGIAKQDTSWYFFPFAVGNLLGPLILGPLFDVWGRRRMICGTYLLAGGTLLVSAILFDTGSLSAASHTVMWCIAFFFASAGASSAYLTVSEVFPTEVRGQAISYFFAIAQGVGSLGPTIYGSLTGEGFDRTPLTWGYALSAVIMIAGGVVAWYFGVDAERKSLEDVAEPLGTVREKP